MKNKKYVLDNLDQNDLKLILESLLYSTSVDVCSDWNKEEILNILTIALKIRTSYPEIITENVILHEYPENVYHDEHSSTIPKYFPDIINK
jgi:hypothetical protein